MNSFILQRFYEAHDLLMENCAETKYQGVNWTPHPMEKLPSHNQYFNFDCYGMFFSWIFRNKLEYIKNDLLLLWNNEAKSKNYGTKYGDILWFSYLLANNMQKQYLKEHVFPSWNDHYRKGNVNFSEQISYAFRNININNEKIQPGDIIIWCNHFQNKPQQKYGHIVIALEHPKFISKEKCIIKCGETTNEGLQKGLQIKNRIFTQKGQTLFYRNKFAIITRIY